jgi:class 3 adenylate cyclase/tetratricopeptide (TPR) repeat protein
MPAMAACRACGAESPPDARFCPRCGTPLQAESSAAEERKLVTVLFVDVTGFTGLGDRLDPERVRAILSRYFSAMSTVIESWGGTIEKYIGDAIMAVFGVPRAREDDAERALRAALEMRERLAALNVELMAQQSITVAVRVGINSGEVIAPLDAHAAGQRIVTGDAVNVAARLEEAAKPGTVLVGERTFMATRDQFRFGDAITFDVRGKPRPIVAHELIGTPASATLAPRLRAPMIGRDRDLAVLHGLLEAAIEAGQTRLAIVFGPAGIGKSRLVAELVETVRSGVSGARVLRGRCLSAGHATAFWPLAEILRAGAGVALDDPADVAWAKLRAHVVATLDEGAAGTDADERVVHALAATTGHALADGPLASLEPQAVADEMGRAWARYASGRVAAAPGIWIVEDLHWADERLLVMLERILARSSGPLLIVATARPEFVEAHPGFPGTGESTTTIALQPLTKSQSQELIDGLLSSTDLPEGVRLEILARADGNPFFLEELLQQLIDRGDLRFAGGRWRSTADVGDLALPDTVHALLAARIDALTADEKHVIHEAAVIGRTFWTSPLSAALPSIDVPAALLSLERRGLILARAATSLSGEDEFLFKHALVREVAYAGVPKTRRARAHAEVAAWLDSRAGGGGDELGQLVASHYRQAFADPDADLAWADDPVERTRVRGVAFASLISAGAAARARFSEAAFDLHSTALAIAADDLETAAAQEAIGDDHRAFYRGDGALRAYQAAIAIRRGAPGGRGDVARLASKVGMMAQRFGAFERIPPADVLESIAEEGLAAVGEAEDTAIRIRLLIFYANMSRIWVGSRMGRLLGPDREDPVAPSERRAAAEKALSLARTSGLADETAEALDSLAELYVLAGDWPAYRGLIAEHLALVDRITSPSDQIDALFEGARAKSEEGAYEEALTLARRAMAIADGLSPHEWMHASHVFAMAAWPLGHWDEIVALAPRHLELAAREPDVTCSAVRGAGLVAARILVERGRGEEAARLVPLPAHVPERIAFANASLLADYALAAGRLDLVKEVVDQMLGMRRGLLSDGVGVVIDGLVALGDWSRLAGFLPLAREISAGIAILGPMSDRAEGVAAAAAGDEALARDRLRAALAGFDRLGAIFEAARTRDALAPLAPAEASELRATALATYESLQAGARIEAIDP